MSVVDSIQQILKELPTHQSNPNQLASDATQLSVLLYNLGDEVAAAELLETQTALGHLDQVLMEGEKKISVAEAEKRGLAETNNEYGRLKLNYQSLVEVIQSIKKQIDSSNQQLKSGV